MIILPVIMRRGKILKRSGVKATNCPVALGVLDAEIMRFRDCWPHKGDKYRLQRAFYRLVIKFEPGKHFDNYANGEKAVGEVVSKYCIRLASDTPTMRRGALHHELVHWALLVLEGDPDSNHNSPGGGWGAGHDQMLRRLIR